MSRWDAKISVVSVTQLLNGPKYVSKLSKILLA